MGALLMLALFATPFWESKPPSEWSDQDLKAFLRSSPWVQISRINVPSLDTHGDRDADLGELPDGAIQVTLASAAPVVQAEQEWHKRHPPAGDAVEDEYASEFYDFIGANPGKYIALGVRLERPQQLEKQKQTAEMEKRCELKIGKRHYKLVGHFLPSPADPYLRLIFPRELKPEDEDLEFTLFLPGISMPHRKVTFWLKELAFKGKLEL